MKKTVLICLYGLLDASRRTEIEMRGYQAYLSRARQFCLNLLKEGNLDKIVLSGGYTDPGISEAKSVFPFFAKYFDKKYLLLQEEGVNTTQNIKIGVEFVVANDYSKDVVVICDDHRMMRVWAICKYYQTQYSEIILKVKSFPREDIHPNSNFIKQTIASFFYLAWPSRFINIDLKEKPP